MIRVALLGAHDARVPVATEWLMTHPQVQLAAICSKDCAGNMVEDAYPRLINRLRMPLEELSCEQIVERSDVVLSFLPQGESLRNTLEILKLGGRVIDLSPDYRFSNAVLYEKWYGQRHLDPTRLGQVPLGIAELFGESFPGSALIACPGCLAAPSILCLAPLIKERLVSNDDLIIDLKAGVSSLDGLPHPSSCYCDRTENVEAYSVGSHRQQAEIHDAIERYARASLNVAFTPHLVPMERGLLTTIYGQLQKSVTANQVRECLLTYYQGCRFVRVVSHLPSTKVVLGTNYIDISVRENGPRLSIMAATDNYLRGGVGTAIQAMNRMFGIDESEGLVVGRR